MSCLSWLYLGATVSVCTCVLPCDLTAFLGAFASQHAFLSSVVRCGTSQVQRSCVSMHGEFTTESLIMSQSNLSPLPIADVGYLDHFTGRYTEFLDWTDAYHPNSPDMSMVKRKQGEAKQSKVGSADSGQSPRYQMESQFSSNGDGDCAGTCKRTEAQQASHSRPTPTGRV